MHRPWHHLNPCANLESTVPDRLSECLHGAKLWLARRSQGISDHEIDIFTLSRVLGGRYGRGAACLKDGRVRVSEEAGA